MKGVDAVVGGVQRGPVRQGGFGETRVEPERVVVVLLSLGVVSESTTDQRPSPIERRIGTLAEQHLLL